jgi:type VI secretion system protein ImpC
MNDKQTVTQQDSDLVEVENFAPPSSLLDSIISQSRVARSETERTRTRDLIGELVSQVLEGEMTPSKDLIAVLDARIAEIDAMLSEQMKSCMPGSSSSWKRPGAA